MIEEQLNTIIDLMKRQLDATEKKGCSAEPKPIDLSGCPFPWEPNKGKDGGEKPVPVSIHYDKDGKADGVLVRTLDMAFIVDLHDAEGGKLMTWKKAMKNHNVPSIQQLKLMQIYKDQINKCLVEAGGDALRENEYYWSSTECNACYAWLVYFSGYYSSSYDKCCLTYCVRAVAAFN